MKSFNSCVLLVFQISNHLAFLFLCKSKFVKFDQDFYHKYVNRRHLPAFCFAIRTIDDHSN